MTVTVRNIRLRLTVKLNVGSLSLVEEVNDPNIRLCLTVKINVGSLSLAAEVNDLNIHRYTGSRPGQLCRDPVYKKKLDDPALVWWPFAVFFFLVQSLKWTKIMNLWLRHHVQAFGFLCELPTTYWYKYVVFYKINNTEFI